MTTLLSVACAVGIGWTSGGHAGNDPCVGAIPTTLRLAVQKALPGYQPARATDPRLASAGEKGLHECMAVARGDFNGDNREDYGLLLTAENDSGAMLAVALRVGETWQVQSLRPFKKGELVNLYVTTAAPGTYGSAEGLSGALEPGEMRSFHSKRVGIVTGTLEASAVGYFWTPQGWIHVWISD